MSVLEKNSRRKMLLGQDGNSLMMLLVINAVLFAILAFIKVVYLLNGSGEVSYLKQVLPYFSVSADIDVFITRPWTMFVYMFTQEELWALITSMLWLWGFGFIFQDLAGNKKLIPVYLYGGVAGSLFFLATVNVIPAIRENVSQIPPLLGAGPSIMAVAIATTTLAPRYKIFPFLNGGIPLWILTTIYLLINFATVGSANVGYAMAQVAGAAIGFVFVWQMQKGNDWSEWMNNFVTWMDDLFNPEKKRSAKSEKQKLHYHVQQKPFVRTPHITQQRVDDLLDKISQKGYNSLTEEEKDFLKKASAEEF